MSIQMILLPLFVQVALTFAVLFALGAVRGRAIREKAVGREAVQDDTVFPPQARQVANNFRNQFEMPVLFYVLTALALLTRKADIVFVCWPGCSCSRAWSMPTSTAPPTTSACASPPSPSARARCC